MLDGSDFIALGATLIALVALFVSIAEATANRPRLRITYFFGFGVGGIDGDWLGVSVINFGRQPTTISAVSVDLPRSRNARGQPRQVIHMPRPSTPGDVVSHFLEVGREARFMFNLEDETEDIMGLGLEAGTLRETFKRYGARIKVSTTWRERPFFKTADVSVL